MKRKDSDEEILVKRDENEENVAETNDISSEYEKSSLNNNSNGDILSLKVPDSLISSRRNSGSSRVSSVQGDLPYQSGNTGRSNNEAGAYRELFVPGEPLPEEFTNQAWEINYREASIFLEEGQNNDKFLHHPRDRESLPAYLLVHSQWFNVIDLLVSVVILALGFAEQNEIPFFQVPILVHSSIELCGLVLMTVQLYLKTRWIGWRSFLKHKRTLIKGLTLIVMIAEAVVVLVRNKSHFRVTRALRILFLIDTHYCGGVRRFIRQIFKSLPPILDMLGLLLFIMVIYSVLGFYLFGPSDTEDGSPYFQTFFLSFINLFVLLTTANFPDVMMPSYYKNSLSFLFFFSYLMINLYFLMNLLLAVVYDSFTAEEVKKFKKLFLHKRKACQHAFKLLVTKENPHSICFVHFSGLVSYYSPSSTPMDNLLMFKLMNESGTNNLTQEEFYGIYDAVEYQWKPNKNMAPYYESCKKPFSMISGAISLLVKSKTFDYTIYMLIIFNGILLIVQTSSMVHTNAIQSIYAPWVSNSFISIYTIEMILKLIGLGIPKYFSSPWNIFDCLITLLGISSVVLTELSIQSYYIMILRPLRLLRLFKVKKRFRDVFGTFIILMPRLNSAMIILVLVFYFFGVIGVETFSKYQLQNCCKNTTVEPYYNYADNSSGIGYYYLNNFNNLPRAYVTLFELMVVNNWFIIMEGYASVTGTDWSRLYFMGFYLFTMVVVTIIVAFILEAFLFRIQYKQKMNKDEEIKVLSETIAMDREEVFYLDSIYERGGKSGFKEFAIDNVDQTGIEFIGTKKRTKEELQKMMYKDETVEWLEEAKREEDLRALEFQQAILSDTTRSPDESLQVLHNNEDEVVTIRRHLMNQPRNPSLSA
eukprot:GFUD01013709.1.p1 GENE.GFUD01013709.1~~GFUD01013709.1.p1  ORF type:complete len:872 (+),score=167.61 GFUD01013709.1:299-2914(+)